MSTKKSRMEEAVKAYKEKWKTPQEMFNDFEGHIDLIKEGKSDSEQNKAIQRASREKFREFANQINERARVQKETQRVVEEAMRKPE